MKAFDTTPLMRGLSGVDGLGAMGTSKAADLHASFEVAASIAVLSVRRLRRRTTLFGGNKMVSKTMGAWGSFLFLSNLITGAFRRVFFSPAGFVRTVRRAATLRTRTAPARHAAGGTARCCTRAARAATRRSAAYHSEHTPLCPRPKSHATTTRPASDTRLSSSFRALRRAGHAWPARGLSVRRLRGGGRLHLHVRGAVRAVLRVPRALLPNLQS
jgi:hypothetical protein